MVRVRKLIGRVLVGLAFTVIVVGLLLWLAGVFEPKIGPTTPGGAVALRTLPQGAAVAEVVRLELPGSESAVGTIEAQRQTSVASRILSRVLVSAVEAGQHVDEGEVLVQLDDSDLRQRLDQAIASVDARSATLDQAQEELTRTERSAEAAAASSFEIMRVRNVVRAAEAELERARQAVNEAQTVLDYATIRAPFSGTVIDRLAEVGDTVTPGTPLLAMYDPTRMQLVASVRETLAVRVSVGDEVEAEIESLGVRCRARVAEIVPEANAQSRSFRMKVTGPCPPGVFPGMFGRLYIATEPVPVVAVASGAVRSVGQLHLVDVVHAEGVAGTLERRAVQLGRELPEGLVEVLAGLAPGERVLLPDEKERGE